MSKEVRPKKSSKASPDWHPYNVWQRQIRDLEGQQASDDAGTTGSWRTDTVWQKLIKGT